MSSGFNSLDLTVPASLVPTHTFAIDFGGSLAKLAHVTESKGYGTENERTLHLVTFESGDLESCLGYARENIVSRIGGKIVCRSTGVGCYKYRNNIMASLGLQINPDCNEMLHAARGLAVLWRHLPKADLLHDGSDLTELIFNVPIQDSGLLPCLLVNLGSAMTIIKVDSEGRMRDIVGGSTFAGLSFLGLGALLTTAKSFSELVEMASRGNHENVDLLVGDTAGSAYNMCPVDGMVSSFGKAAARLRPGSTESKFQEEDLANSLLKSVTDNLAVNCYYASKSENARRVCFCGSFIGGNPTIIRLINAKLREASAYLGHKVNPVFLRPEAYLGAVGALVGPNVITGIPDDG